MKVLVVIVNYKTADLTIDCLKTLAPEIARVPGAHCIVVDNNSPDDSAAVLAKQIPQLEFSEWCDFAALDRNGGFAYGNNQAIRRIADRPEFIWLLNPDTLVLPGALTELLTFMESHPNAGIAGGRAENRDGTVRRSCFRFHTVQSEFEYAIRFGPISKMLRQYVVAPEIPTQPAKVQWVSGASMMIRQEVIEQIGLLDDEYFMYFEETDFCLRAARAGFECWYIPQSRIVHLVGQSSGVTGKQQREKRRPKYWFDSRRRFFQKNYGTARMHLANLLWLGAFPVGRTWQMLRRRPRTEPPWLWWDFLKYNYLSK